MELSLKAIENVQRERQRLNRHWEQRLERVPMMSSVPNASIRPSSPKIAWSRGAWSSSGRRLCVHNAI